MMAVAIRTTPALELGSPRALFSFVYNDLVLSCFPGRCFDVSRDGEQFYGIQRESFRPPDPATRIHLVQNWLEEVKARVPAGR